ncbi:MAG: PKD domain-containing protein [Calditrichaeota bacterium]|nr:MAG: PKD domain-containing protein [Calditrichota bacterium]
MKKLLTIVFVLSLLTVGMIQAEKFAPVNQQQYITSENSFVGYVENRVIVVLKEGVVVDHAKDKIASVALNGLDGFSEVAQRFEVHNLQPLFPGSDVRSMSASASPALSKLSRHYKIEFNTGTLDEVIAAYEALPQVDHVEKDAIHRLYAEANDTYYKQLSNPNFQYNQWHYFGTYGMNAESGWDTNAGDATVVVGVLDSGVRYYHVDLGGSNPPGPNDNSTNGNIWTNPGETPGNGIDDDGNGYVDDVVGYDFFESGYSGVSCQDTDCGTKDNDPADHNGHGTHVAGTIGAITNNGTLVAGVAGGFAAGTINDPANGVKVIPCRIGYTGRYRGQTSGFVMMSAAAEAMYYLGDLKASGTNVAAINCSWGSSNSGGLGAAVDYLLSQDVMIIVAAGNSNSSSPDYLGNRTDCMDVGATDKNGNPASFSNYGSWVDIAAPGTEILSTYHESSDPGGDYIALLDGTSMSCPHVVGVAALLESHSPTLSAQQKWDLMVQNTTAYNMTKNVGVGIVNAAAALAAVGGGGQNNPPVANFSGTPTSGTVPLNVQFTDLSSNNPTSWSWTFGDGGSSSAENPSYTYNSTGTYTVTLTATNAYGSDGETKTGYITVTDPPQGGTMHVHDIVVTRVSKGPNDNGVGTITIYDDQEQPVANASVTVVADGPTGGTGTATTNASGEVSFNTSKVKNPSGEWCFEVTNVTHASNTYNDAENHVTRSCESGDVFSNGVGAMTALPNTFGLNQNYPNPFNPSTEISFSLPQASTVKLEVFNIRGQKVEVLASGQFSAGHHSVTWDASSNPSGIYLYRLTAGDKVETKKMVLMK